MEGTLVTEINEAFNSAHISLLRANTEVFHSEYRLHSLFLVPWGFLHFLKSACHQDGE